MSELNRNKFHKITGPRSFANCKQQTLVVTKVEGKPVESFQFRPGKTAHDKATGAWKSKEQRRASHESRRMELTSRGKGK